MASTSLGTLTLDLAVRLSEFTDGLTQAERQTAEKTKAMGDSVSKFKDGLIDDLSGTPIGDAIGSLTDRLDKIRELFGDTDLGIAGAAKIGAAAVIAATVGMAVGLTTMAIQVAETDSQLQVLANRANVTTTQFQVLAAAVSDYGIDNEGLSDILADAQEKLGEFAATGAGGLLDTLELLQNNTKMSAEEVEAFGVSLSNVEGSEAIQMVKDKLEEVGASAQITRFTMESLASGLGDISEVWEDGGSTIADYEQALYSAGVIRTQEAIEQSAILKSQVEDTQRKFQGMSNQLVTYTTPALNSVVGYFAEGAKQGDGFASSVNGVGVVVSGVAKIIIGFSSVVNMAVIGFQGLMDQFYVLGQTGTAFLNADGLFEKIQALKNGSASFAAAGASTDRRFAAEAERAANAINNTGTIRVPTNVGGSNSELERLRREAAMLQESNIISTKTADDNAKALEKQAKAAGKTAKAIKELGSAYVSNTALSGLKLKSNEAIEGGKARGYTAEFAELTQSILGGNLKYFSAINDTYHKGSNSKHATGQAFDVVLNDAKQAKKAVAEIKAAAKEYGYQVKILDEYANPSKNATGGHLHVSVYGQKDNGKGGADIAWIKQQNSKVLVEQQKAATEEKRALEELERAKLSINQKYASDREKIESNHTNNVIEIERLYAEGSSERTKYLAREEERYAIEKNAGLLSIAEKYFSEEQRIHDAHKKAMAVIDQQFAKDDSNRQLYVDLQNAAYQEDLANFKFASQAKAREQDKMYQSIANSMKANGLSAASTGLDSMAQRTMSDDEYAVWRLAQDRDEAFNSVNSQYSNRQAEINAVDERGNYALPELERFELLEVAKQEHLDNMWSMEQEYALRQQSLDEQMGATRVAIQQSAFGSMTSIAAMFFGESSRMHQAAFIMERTYATQKALMNVKETYSNTFNAISAIPLIGPYIAMPMAAAASAIQVAQAAGIGSISVPSVAGIAHGGLDNVPEEATYLLQKDERVLSPKQNKDLVKFMANGQKASYGGITINESPGAQASVRREPDGGVTVDMVDKMIEKSFRRIGRPNSIESKSVRRGTTARVNRS
ncbi:hypothetical protein [Psychrobacter sp. PSP]|uniref:hypothetical protein n=1 Tax=Psychrobacter sp. PSP TaxID=2734636 RepID=UPI0020954296|nr:hypothetical protein [Psychrobacter sp. PSP]